MTHPAITKLAAALAAGADIAEAIRQLEALRSMEEWAERIKESK